MNEVSPMAHDVLNGCGPGYIVSAWRLFRERLLSARRLRWALMARPAATLVLCFALTGCVMSIKPAVPASEAVFESRLVGTWICRTESDSERAVISGEPDQPYLIEYTGQDRKSGKFLAYAGYVGTRLVLEVHPESATLGQLKASGGYIGMLLPAHMVFVVDPGAKEMQVAILDVDSVRAALNDGRLQSPYLNLGESAFGSKANPDVLLTGTTDQVRATVAQAMTLPGALKQTSTWRRVGRDQAATDGHVGSATR